MIVYRIVKTIKRADDLSGMGAWQVGGRWNSPGTYMLYTSENSSLAFLENLVYFEAHDMPRGLFMIAIELNAVNNLTYTLPDEKYPASWMLADGLESKLLGDKLMTDKKYLAVKVRSKVNPYEYNYLLNPLFPGYHDLVKIISVHELPIDNRLIL